MSDTWLERADMHVPRTPGIRLQDLMRAHVQGMRLETRAERQAGQGPAGARSTNAFVRRRSELLVAGGLLD